MTKGSTKSEISVILTHEHTDFDGLASLLAAHKLYTHAKAVLPQRPNRNLIAFLSLYQDGLPFVRREEVERTRVTEAFLVDTQAASPIKGMGEWTRLRIIDHHPLAIELAEGSTYHGEPLGATTTLLLEEIRQQGIRLSPIEATLLLLGIHEDTGSLTYATTTPRDAYAAAWLLEQGANLPVLNNYLHRPLSEEQVEVYRQIIAEGEMQQVHGYHVLVVALALQSYVEELSTLTHKVNDILDPDASFMLFSYRSDVQLIARSTVEGIDVGEIARRFGGGGHSKAAAAVIQSAHLGAVRAELEAMLAEVVRPPVVVRDIMSFGVRTLRPDMTIWDAELEARKYGHEGFPVLEKGELVGVITRREIESALHHKLASALVGAYMRRGDIRVSPSDPVENVPEIMTRYDVGQVPVVEDGAVIGIVTRTDVVRRLVAPSQRPEPPNLVRMMEETIPSARRDLIIKARDAANALDYSLYIVGGFVRDLLLGIPDLDVDLVVEGDAIKVAHKLAADMSARVRSHRRFGTAKVVLESADGASVDALDLATTRVEFYERGRPALPRVESSSIREDLKRRDFTINTLAICLDKNRYGELLDPFGGIQDLRDGRIRVLHNFSFIEDPTRILRAVRLEQRLDFAIEPQTLSQIRDDVERLRHVTGPRIRNELELILREREPEKSWLRLSELGALEPIHPALCDTEWVGLKFPELRAWWKRWLASDPAEAPLFDVEALSASNGNGAQPPPLLYWCLVTYLLSDGELSEVAARLRITRKDEAVMRQANQLCTAQRDLSRSDLSPSEVFHLLSSSTEVALIAAYVASDDPVARRHMEAFQHTLRHIKPRIDGDYLRALGLAPGPDFGRILTHVQDAILNGKIHTQEEEEAMVQDLIKRAL